MNKIKKKIDSFFTKKVGKVMINEDTFVFKYGVVDTLKLCVRQYYEKEYFPVSFICGNYPTFLLKNDINSWHFNCYYNITKSTKKQ